ncbi:hypothetical protein NLS1_31260 [Nocardioides sp. LS1]|nr:hypothetical protein NLS1_31260 [Nocardioides sp. LS1]
MPRVAFFAKVIAKPGQRARLLALFDKASEHAQREPGTLIYAVHAVDDESDAVYLYELYEDAQAHRRHSDGHAVAVLRAGLPELVEEPIAVTKGLYHGGFGLCVEDPDDNPTET